MASIKTFPEIVFITVEEDDGEDYMLASLTKRDALNQEPAGIVGMYKFVQSEFIREGDVVAVRRKTRKTA